jgi:hypothetical protein
VQALVRPLAEHDALFALTVLPAAHWGHSMIDSAEAFARMLADSPADAAKLVIVEAATTRVWWDVLERYPQLAVWVAANRTVPEEILTHLAQHGSTPVRAAVASGPGVSEELLLRLAHDKDDLIRLRVACNSKATRNVLAALVGDACPGVSAHAQARLTHDISGVSLPASYLDDLRELDWLH